MATGNGPKEWQIETVLAARTDADVGSTGYRLAYEGKQDAAAVVQAPALATYVPVVPAAPDPAGRLYFGDNLDVLRHLLATGYRARIDLIYIDPPYATNSVFHTRHGHSASYRDDLVGAHFLEFLRQRLLCMYELLAPTGSIYVHLDGHMIAEVQVLMEEIFGSKNLRALITRRKCSNKNSTRNTYGNVSDYILYFTKTNQYCWHRPVEAWTEDRMLKEYGCVEEGTGRRYKKVPIHAPGIRNGETGQPWRGMLPPPGKHWQYVPRRLDELDARGEIYWSATGNPRRKVYFDTSDGVAIQDIWLDVPDTVNQNTQATGYPTEKNAALLERIIKASSSPGDLVLDCFAGSGTTLGVAQAQGRRWLGIDNSLVAIDHIFKRFLLAPTLLGTFASPAPRPSALAGQTSLFAESAPPPLVARQALFEFLSDGAYLAPCVALAEKWVGA